MHTANALAYFKKIFLFKKIYYLGILRKKCISTWISQRKNHFLHFEILQHVCKIQRVLANISKKYKNLPFGNLLFTVVIWINKSLGVNIQNIRRE